MTRGEGIIIKHRFKLNCTPPWAEFIIRLNYEYTQNVYNNTRGYLLYLTIYKEYYLLKVSERLSRWAAEQSKTLLRHPFSHN